MPWARRKARFTRDFKEWVACLARRAPRRRGARAWSGTRSARCAPASAPILRPHAAGAFEGARRIGIDKTSYKKGHKYLIVVIDHDRGWLIWAHEGYGKDVLNLFFDELT
ncbi:MAG: hypothetical protein DUD39_10440 [Coriobacteriaceae bacterium]|nr:MAG: hypothetical protein DUD39_10440 [Coriobacteriaceae bacterium]